MADYEQIMTALRNAHAAGDTAGAARLALMAQTAMQRSVPAERPRSVQLMDEYKQAEAAGDTARADDLLRQATFAATQDGTAPDSVAMNPATGRMEDMALRGDRGRGNAAMQGAGQGLSFGLMDEAVGGLYGMTGPGSFAENRDYAQTSMRGDLASGRENYPVTALGAEVLGGAASSIGGAAALGMRAAPTIGGRAVQGGGIGAVEGGLYGFGSGEGGLGNRAASAGQGAMFGAAVGAAAPYAIEGVRQGFDKAVGGPLASMRSAPNAVRASRAVQTAIERSRRTPEQISQAITEAQRAGQGQYAIADATGYSGQRMLAGAARTPGDGRDEIVNYLMNRQQGQGRRIGGAVDDALNSSAGNAGKTAEQVRDALTAARTASGNAEYSAARQGAGPVNLTPAIEQIDTLIGRDPLLGDAGLAQTEIGNRLVGIRNQITNDQSQLIDFDRVLNIKQDMYSTIQGLKKSGKSVPKELTDTYAAIDRALELSSAGYRQANDNFARASRTIEQVDNGRAATSPRARTGDVRDAYKGLTPEQQAAFRAGYSDPLMARIEGAAPGVNKARPLLDDASQAELGMMARNPQDLAAFLRREDEMFRTGNAAMGGSMTADNLADAADVAGFNSGALANLLAGRLGAAISQMGGGAVNAMMGRNTATRELIAKMLLSQDVSGALAPALQRAATNGQQSALAQAFIRSIERTANPR